MRGFLTGSFFSFATAALLFWQFSSLPNALRWPARILIVLLLLNGVRRFVPAWLALAQILTRMAGAAARIAGSALQRHAGSLKGFELLAALLLVAATLPGVFGSASAMMHHSLTTDEISSVRRYSGRGPIETATRYPRANNHVFFNLINSVLPGAGSFNPPRARMISFAAVAGILALPLLAFWRGKHYAAGALLFAWLGANHDLLTFHLLGRGYGLLAFIAFLTAIAFLRSHPVRTPTVALLAVLTVLGTYTLPFYLLFGGLLLVFLFLERPTIPLFLAGIWSLIAVILLYLPLAGDFLKTAGTYTDDYGFSLNNPASFNRAIGQFWPVPPPTSPLGEVAIVLTAFLLLAGLPGPRSFARRRALLLASAVAAFFAFGLFYDTVPERVLAFLAAPVALAFTLLALELFNSRRLLGIGRLLGPVACLAAVPWVFALPNPATELPDENWQELGHTLRLLIPAETKVWTDRYDNNVAVYLPDSYKVEEGGSPPFDDLVAGRAVLHDSGHNATSRVVTLDAASVPEGTRTISYPLKGGSSALYWMPAHPGRQIQPTTTSPSLTYLVPSEMFVGLHGAALRRSAGWQNVGVMIDERPLPRDRWLVVSDWLILGAPEHDQSLRLQLPAGAPGEAVEFVAGVSSGDSP